MEHLSQPDKEEVINIYQNALELFIKHHNFSSPDNLKEEMHLCFNTIVYDELKYKLDGYEDELGFNLVDSLFNDLIEDAIEEALEYFNDK